MDEVKEAEESATTLKETGSDSADLANNSQATQTKAAKRMKQKMRSLRRLLVSKLQIIATILGSIMWSPDVPKFLIDTLRFVANIFTINVPGLLTSVDCLEFGSNGEGMGPVSKWYLQLFFPFGLLVFFFIWYHCLPSATIAKSTVKEASVQVGFVWLFETIVTSSLKPLDCTSGDPGKLVMDPREICPLGYGGKSGLAVLGLFVLILYLFPYIWLVRKRSFGFCGGCFRNLRKCYEGKGCCDCCLEDTGNVWLDDDKQSTAFTPEACSKMRVGAVVGKFCFLMRL